MGSRPGVCSKAATFRHGLTDLAYVRVGRALRFLEADLEEFILRSRHAAAAQQLRPVSPRRGARLR